MADKKPTASAAPPIEITGNAVNLLSDEEIAAARRKAREKVDAIRHQKAIDEIVEQETRRLQMEDGLVTGIGIKDEMVDILVELEFGIDGIPINGRMYRAGQIHTVPRHVADTLREIMFRVHQQEEIRKGSGIMEQQRNMRNTKISLRTGVVVGGVAPTNMR